MANLHRSLVIAIVLAGGTSTAQPQRTERPPDPPPAPSASAPNVRGSLATVRFARGSSDVDPRDRQSLAAAARWLRDHPYRLLVVEGYPDEIGGAANLDLSERRSEAVRELLLDLGADPVRMVEVAFGDSDEEFRGPMPIRSVVVRSTQHEYPDLVRAQRPRDDNERDRRTVAR